MYLKSKKEKHDFSTCAVVGNAATMKNSGVGEQISAHTAVFRFNEAPYKGFEKDVGRGLRSTTFQLNLSSF